MWGSQRKKTTGCNEKKKSINQQATRRGTLSDLCYHLKEVMNNQKCGLTSFIWSKVNVPNNKKHVLGRDIVQSEWTVWEERWPPSSSSRITGYKKGVDLKKERWSMTAAQQHIQAGLLFPSFAEIIFALMAQWRAAWQPRVRLQMLCN